MEVYCARVWTGIAQRMACTLAASGLDPSRAQPTGHLPCLHALQGSALGIPAAGQPQDEQSARPGR